MRQGFYCVVLLVALAGQVSGAVEALHIPLLFAIPAVGALELGGIVVLANADVRRRLGERAVASRLLSVAIAAGAVAFNWMAHHNHLLGGFFAGMSALGYLVWLMHTENQRRDRLRAKGDLPPTTPAYEVMDHWLRHPWLTRRARSMAKANPDLGLYDSLAAARSEVRRERRQSAISKVLHRKIRSAVDPMTADIALAVYDLDEIATRLADNADYDGLTAIIATDLAPARLAAGMPVARRGRKGRGQPLPGPLPMLDNALTAGPNRADGQPALPAGAPRADTSPATVRWSAGPPTSPADPTATGSASPVDDPATSIEPTAPVSGQPDARREAHPDGQVTAQSPGRAAPPARVNATSGESDAQAASAEETVSVLPADVRRSLEAQLGGRRTAPAAGRSTVDIPEPPATIPAQAGRTDENRRRRSGAAPTHVPPTVDAPPATQARATTGPAPQAAPRPNVRRLVHDALDQHVRPGDPRSEAELALWVADHLSLSDLEQASAPTYVTSWRKDADDRRAATGEWALIRTPIS
jgi:hypothetical protein